MCLFKNDTGADSALLWLLNGLVQYTKHVFRFDFVIFERAKIDGSAGTFDSLHVQEYKKIWR